jgi:hypothetical protein
MGMGIISKYGTKEGRGGKTDGRAKKTDLIHEDEEGRQGRTTQAEGSLQTQASNEGLITDLSRRGLTRLAF